MIQSLETFQVTYLKIGFQLINSANVMTATEKVNATLNLQTWKGSLNSFTRFSVTFVIGSSCVKSIHLVCYIVRY